MTKIFVTIPWFVPAFRAGGPIQSIANLVTGFQENVEYYIYCSDTDLNDAELDNIEKDKWIYFNEHTQVWYASPEKISDTLLKTIEKIKPDILYIIGMFSWHYNIVPLLFCKAPKKILSTRGMLHPGALSQKKWKKRIFLNFFKLLNFHHTVTFHVTNNEEKQIIRNLFGDKPEIFIAGNFPNKIGPLPAATKEPGFLKLASIAIISPMKNILLILQALEHSVNHIEYHIYGPVKDEEYWELCKEKIKELPENIRIIYHKEIEPNKVKEALSFSHVFILPSRSENFGHALYEALSAGRPVITSNNTPWNLLKESHAGINVSIEDYNELTEAIDFFASMDKETLQIWQQGAANYADREVQVEDIIKEHTKMFSIPPSMIKEESKL